jgi:hypothetical protein
MLPLSTMLGFSDVEGFTVLFFLALSAVLLVLVVVLAIHAHRAGSRARKLKAQVAALEAASVLKNGTVSSEGDSVIYDNPYPDETPLPYGPAPQSSDAADANADLVLPEVGAASDAEDAASVAREPGGERSLEDAVASEIAEHFAPVAEGRGAGSRARAAHSARGAEHAQDAPYRGRAIRSRRSSLQKSSRVPRSAAQRSSSVTGRHSRDRHAAAAKGEGSRESCRLRFLRAPEVRPSPTSTCTPSSAERSRASRAYCLVAPARWTGMLPYRLRLAGNFSQNFHNFF